MNNLRLFNGRGRTVRQLDALHEVGNLALAIATERYGSGFPDHNGGKVKKLGFNNARHNQKVGDNAARLCKYLGFSELEQELARTAGYAHDIRQLTGRGNDEAESAAWVERKLRETGVIEPEMAELAGLAISGTLPLFKSGQMIGQTANHLDDVSGAKELFVKTVASADLSELYTPAGPYLAHMLYGQQMGYEADEDPPMDRLVDFQDKQMALLKAYHYPLPEAKRLYATHTREVVEYMGRVWSQLKRNEINTWTQLLEQDIAFMNDCTESKMHHQISYEFVA